MWKHLNTLNPKRFARVMKRFIHERESGHSTFARENSGLCLLKMAVNCQLEVANARCILLQDQVVYFVMSTSVFLRKHI